MKFYITTSIAYTNADPHIGYALELIQADVLARYHRQRRDEVWFLTGTDEHGIKIARAADAAGVSPHKFVADISTKFQDLATQLHISNDDFIRTTDQDRHWPAVTKLWMKLTERGDIYKKEYEGLYCVGHEAFIKKSELIDGLCPVHKSTPEVIKEENWFFRLAKYKDQIRDYIERDDLRIVPATRKKEILNMFDDAEDISFSRPAAALQWGIPVPNDPSQTIYVWADALTNYISALGYATEEKAFKTFWPADIHLIGKDIIRFHAMYWPAMLLSAQLALPKAIYVHGFITVGGQKMSKSIGNVVDPREVLDTYGADVVRYFLLREISSGDDGDFSYKNLESRYDGDLANGLGNLIQRVATLIDTKMDRELIYKKSKAMTYISNIESYEHAIGQFRLHDALGEVWKLVGQANQYIDVQKPWAQAKEHPEEFLKTMTTLVAMIHSISYLLVPFMPETAKKIADIFGNDLAFQEIPENHHLVITLNEQSLFPRLSQ